MVRGIEPEVAAKETQRLDKWLWFARLAKTRTLAAALVSSGKVRLNRVRIDKPSHAVRAGDVLTVVAGRRVRLLRVLDLGLRRGPPATALTLYEELTGEIDAPKPHASIHATSGGLSAAGHGQRPAGAGRPTKKERREIDRLNRKTR